ncbi:MAG: hypothetical protein CVU56_25570 [Deltaproteobacteria bacterium HGW-Deltaproteobacteria-14]|jgi:hypothetical protein|nr:MAG: hypothetical protein CVU56_25570 [Deltaproteobacteria bacterium HGW-Deltaproteobacteria-14]
MTQHLALVASVLALSAVACGGEASSTADTSASDTAELDSAAPLDTAEGADTGAADTAEGADTTAPDTADVTAGDVADAEDAEDASVDTVDPCAEVKCAAPACPAEQQEIPAGECCPVCVAPTCGASEDCTRCVWPSAPASVDACYCTVCPVALMTQTECAANQAAWELHCGGWAPDPACPVPRCVNEPPPVCDGGVCVEDPEACRSDSDCVRCSHAVAPASPDDCHCPGCGVPMAVTHCEDVAAAVLAQCAGLLDDCLPLPCPAPPPLACNLETSRCEMDFGAPR